MKQWLLVLFVSSVLSCTFNQEGELLPDSDPCGGACTADEVCNTDGTCEAVDACGGTCTVDEVCNPDGTCQSECTGGTTDCAGACVNTDTDPDNCGACGVVCVAGERCDGANGCATCPSERVLPAACTTSSPGELSDCDKLYDALEFGASPQRDGMDSFDCDDNGESSFCDYGRGCDNGCIRDFWIQFDLGAPRHVHRLRYMADWWNKRPDDWELWVSDDPTVTPESGATMVTSGVGHAADWKCVQGAPCDDLSIPDECCPDGREQPQDLRDVDEYWPRFDELEFTGQSGRYWYYVIRNTMDNNSCRLFEMELFGSDCTG